jgi:hypothetical protein
VRRPPAPWQRRTGVPPGRPEGNGLGRPPRPDGKTIVYSAAGTRPRARSSPRSRIRRVTAAGRGSARSSRSPRRASQILLRSASSWVSNRRNARPRGDAARRGDR